MYAPTRNDCYQTFELSIIFSSPIVTPIHLPQKCSSYYNYQLNYNVYNCSFTNIAAFPESNCLTKLTNVMDLSGNKISKLCGKQKYFETIIQLDLSQNVINKICEETVNYMETGSIVELNLANNTIATLPSKLSNISSLQVVKLSGNKFICNCEMTWMIQWLSKRNINGKRIVKDYQDVVCHSGMLVGKQIYKLTSNKMGCYPHKLSTGEKITIGIFGTLIIGITIAIIAISRRWNEVKFFLYLHFDILDKNDGDEDLTNKYHDVFVSYR